MFNRCAIAKEIAEDIERQKCSTDNNIECVVVKEIKNAIISRECSEITKGIRIESVNTGDIVGAVGIQEKDWLPSMTLNPTMDEHRREWHEKKLKSIEEAWDNPKLRKELQITSLPTDCSIDDPNCQIFKRADPIYLVKRDGRYYVETGYHRVSFAKTKGLKKIVAVVIEKQEI